VTGDRNQSAPRAATQTGTEAGDAVTETKGYRKERGAPRGGQKQRKHRVLEDRTEN